MDHLRDENGPIAFDPIEVECELPLITGRARTLEDFWDLPKKEGWTLEEDGTAKPFKIENPPWGHVLQKWLFFEVLGQVFGNLPEFAMGDFVKPSHGKVYITTEKLPHLLHQWQSNEQVSPGTERTLRLVRIQQVLDRARYFVSRYCSVMSVDERPTWAINEFLSISFMILGETLMHAQAKILQTIDFNIYGWCGQDTRNQGWGYSKLLLHNLKTDGWCARAIRKLQALLRGNTIGLLYLYTIRQSSSKGRLHDACKPTECIAEKIGLKNKRPDPMPYHHCMLEMPDHCSEDRPSQDRRNESDGSDCNKWTRVQASELAKEINKGHIPLFRFNRKTGELILTPMKSTFDVSYVIFSHVWADGFGTSEDENKLSTCTLQMFSNLFDKINTASTGGKSTIPEAFWIDTLSIPIGKEFASERTQAIRQMHNIYLHARCTIVLDKGLMKLQKGRGYSKPAMNVTMCSWMTRMWTLQEAVLSSNIYFNFNNQIYAMDNLESLYISEAAALHTCIPSIAQIYFHGILGSQRDHVKSHFLQPRKWKPEAKFVAAVWKATQWRSTDHGFQETLALATLFNLDTKRFTAPMEHEEGTEEYMQDCDNRMRDLIAELSAIAPSPIPPGMIFLPGPRLSTKGYGWAPRTWLSSQEIDSPDPLSLSIDRITNNESTRLNPSEGLEVKFPGFILHNLGDIRNNLHLCSNFSFPTNTSLMEWYFVNIADNDHFPNDTTLDNRELAIIAARLPAVDLKEIALLVAIKRRHAAINYVEILNRVWLTKEERQGELAKLSTKFRAGSIDVFCAAERLPESQMWCVDGPTRPVNIVSLALSKAPVATYDDPQPGPSRSKTWDVIKSRNWSLFA